MTDYTELIDDLRNGGLHGFSIVLKAADAIERLQKERDAAVKDLETCVDDGACLVCKHYKDYPLKGKCRECFQDGEHNFEWRVCMND